MRKILHVCVQEVSFWSAMLGVAAGGYSSRLTFAATNAQFTSNLESFIAIHYDMLVNHPPSSVAMVCTCTVPVTCSVLMFRD